jgi:glycosyltransferase involved in cell wall biosynthesis
VGAAIVASDTPPVQEMIRHNDTGRLVNFFDISGLADNICRLLDDPEERARLGANARNFVRTNYDLQTISLPRQLRWVEALAERSSSTEHA